MPKTLNRVTLAKLCALFSSDKDGEVLAAARKADKLVKASGYTWASAFGKDQPKAKSVVEPNKELLEMIDTCLEYSEWLYDNEERFLENVREWVESGFEPSTKQLAWLKKIHYRVSKLEDDDDA